MYVVFFISIDLIWGGYFGHFVIPLLLRKGNFLVSHPRFAHYIFILIHFYRIFGDY